MSTLKIMCSPRKGSAVKERHNNASNTCSPMAFSFADYFGHYTTEPPAEKADDDSINVDSDVELFSTMNAGRDTLSPRRRLDIQFGKDFYDKKRLSSRKLLNCDAHGSANGDSDWGSSKRSVTSDTSCRRSRSSNRSVTSDSDRRRGRNYNRVQARQRSLGTGGRSRSLSMESNTNMARNIRFSAVLPLSTNESIDSDFLSASVHSYSDHYYSKESCTDNHTDNYTDNSDTYDSQSQSKSTLSSKELRFRCQRKDSYNTKTYNSSDTQSESKETLTNEEDSFESSSQNTESLYSDESESIGTYTEHDDSGSESESEIVYTADPSMFTSALEESAINATDQSKLPSVLEDSTSSAYLIELQNDLESLGPSKSGYNNSKSLNADARAVQDDDYLVLSAFLEQAESHPSSDGSLAKKDTPNAEIVATASSPIAAVHVVKEKDSLHAEFFVACLADDTTEEPSIANMASLCSDIAIFEFNIETTHTDELYEPDDGYSNQQRMRNYSYTSINESTNMFNAHGNLDYETSSGGSAHADESRQDHDSFANNTMYRDTVAEDISNFNNDAVTAQQAFLPNIDEKVKRTNLDVQPEGSVMNVDVVQSEIFATDCPPPPPYDGIFFAMQKQRQQTVQLEKTHSSEVSVPQLSSLTPSVTAFSPKQNLRRHTMTLVGIQPSPFTHIGGRDNNEDSLSSPQPPSTYAFSSKHTQHIIGGSHVEEDLSVLTALMEAKTTVDRNNTMKFAVKSHPAEVSTCYDASAATGRDGGGVHNLKEACDYSSDFNVNIAPIDACDFVVVDEIFDDNNIAQFLRVLSILDTLSALNNFLESCRCLELLDHGVSKESSEQGFSQSKIPEDQRSMNDTDTKLNQGEVGSLIILEAQKKLLLSEVGLLPQDGNIYTTKNTVETHLEFCRHIELLDQEVIEEIRERGYSQTSIQADQKPINSTQTDLNEGELGPLNILEASEKTAIDKVLLTAVGPPSSTQGNLADGFSDDAFKVEAPPSPSKLSRFCERRRRAAQLIGDSSSQRSSAVPANDLPVSVTTPSEAHEKKPVALSDSTKDTAALPYKLSRQLDAMPEKVLPFEARIPSEDRAKQDVNLSDAMRENALTSPYTLIRQLKVDTKAYERQHASLTRDAAADSHKRNRPLDRRSRRATNKQNTLVPADLNNEEVDSPNILEDQEKMLLEKNPVELEGAGSPPDVHEKQAAVASSLIERSSTEKLITYACYQFNKKAVVDCRNLSEEREESVLNIQSDDNANPDVTSASDAFRDAPATSPFKKNRRFERAVRIRDMRNRSHRDEGVSSSKKNYPIGCISSISSSGSSLNRIKEPKARPLSIDTSSQEYCPKDESVATAKHSNVVAYCIGGDAFQESSKAQGAGGKDYRDGDAFRESNEMEDKKVKDTGDPSSETRPLSIDTSAQECCPYDESVTDAKHSNAVAFCRDDSASRESSKTHQDTGGKECRGDEAFRDSSEMEDTKVTGEAAPLSERHLLLSPRRMASPRSLRNIKSPAVARDRTKTAKKLWGVSPTSSPME